MWRVACGLWLMMLCFLYIVAGGAKNNVKGTLYSISTDDMQRITGALSYSPPLTPTSSTVAPGASTTLVPNAADSQQQQRRMLPPHHCRSHWEAAALPLGNSGRRPTNVLCCRHATVNGRREISS